MRFRVLFEKLRSNPAFYSKIYVAFHIAPNGKVEPHDITFYRPVFECGGLR